MTAFSETAAAAAMHAPCDSCVVAAQALRILSASLQTAQQALTHIHIPVPPDVALAMGYRSAEPDEVPQALRDLCRTHGYFLLQAVPNTNSASHGAPVHKNAGAEAHTSPSELSSLSSLAVTEEATSPGDSAVPPSWSCLDIANHRRAAGEISISSESTDWLEEYGISPPPSPVPSETQAISPPVAATEDTPAEERWYAITVGRNPGVYQGSHHVALNTRGVSGFSAQRYKSEQAAQTAYDEALDNGTVTQVNMTDTTRLALSRAA